MIVDDIISRTLVNKSLKHYVLKFSIFVSSKKKLFFFLGGGGGAGGRGDRVRSKSKICNYVAFIFFSLHSTCVYILIRCVTDSLKCLSPETGHGMPSVNFNGLLLLLICQNSYLCLVCHFGLDFKPSMSDFATAALLRRI